MSLCAPYFIGDDSIHLTYTNRGAQFERKNKSKQHGKPHMSNFFHASFNKVTIFNIRLNKSLFACPNNSLWCISELIRFTCDAYVKFEVHIDNSIKKSWRKLLHLVALRGPSNDHLSSLNSKWIERTNLCYLNRWASFGILTQSNTDAKVIVASYISWKVFWTCCSSLSDNWSVKTTYSTKKA